MPFHDQLPPPAWHGAKVETGTLAARPIPQVVGQLYFVNSGASAGKLFIAEGTTAQTDWKEVADLNNLPVQLTVRDPSNNVTLTPTTTLVFPSQWLTVSSSTNTATVTIPNAVTVRDQSNAVSQSNVHTIVFPNSSVTSPTSGEVHISFASATQNLTTRNESNTGSVSPTNTLIVPDHAVIFAPSTNTVTLDVPKKLRVRTINSFVNEMPTDTLVFPDGSLSITSSGTVEVTFPSSSSGLTIEDVSQNVSEPNVNTLVFPDNSLSITGPGQIEIAFPSSSLTVEDASQNVSESGVTRIVVPDGALSVINPGEVELDLSNASGGGSITVRDASGLPSYNDIDTLEVAPSSANAVSSPASNVARIDVRGFELTGVTADYLKTLNVPVYDLLTFVSTNEYELNAIPNKDVCAVLHASNYTVTDAVNSSWYYNSSNALGGSFPFSFVSSTTSYSQPSISSSYVYQPQSYSVRLRQPGLYTYKGRLVFRAYNGLTHFLNPDLEVKVDIFNATTSTGIFTNTHNFPTRAELQFIDDASATSTTYSQGVWFEGYFNLRTSNITLDFDNDSIELFYNITLNGVLSTANVDIRFEFFEIIRVP
jgi:hypothetical protein